MINPFLILLSCVVVRAAVLGAGVGDALAIAALCGLKGWWLYLEQTKKPNITGEMQKQVDEMRTTVQALKMSQARNR